MAEILGPSAPGVRTQTVFSLQVFTTDDEGHEVQIGTATELSPTHERTNTLVGGVGIGDRIMEIVPGRTKYSITLRKFSLWTKNIQQILGFDKNFRMLAEMQKPFDIRVYHLNPNPDKADEIQVTVYKDCVLNRWDRKQEWTDEVVIADECTVDVTMIHANNMPWPSLDTLL